MYHMVHGDYQVLSRISPSYARVRGRLPMRYSPVCRSVIGASTNPIPRLACLRHAASVHPEPGSNSQIKIIDKSIIYDVVITTTKRSFRSVLRQKIKLKFFVLFWNKHLLFNSYFLRYNLMVFVTFVL